MSKKHKKNIFSNNPWNDTPYYDMFIEEWTKYGVIDINHWHAIIDKNVPLYYFNLIKHEIYKWPERI